MIDNVIRVILNVRMTRALPVSIMYCYIRRRFRTAIISAPNSTHANRRIYNNNRLLHIRSIVPYDSRLTVIIISVVSRRPHTLTIVNRNRVVTLRSNSVPLRRHYNLIMNNTIEIRRIHNRVLHMIPVLNGSRIYLARRNNTDNRMCPRYHHHTVN